VVTKTVTLERHIPAALIRPCAPKWSKPGGPATTGDFVERGDVNEMRLTACAAQVRKIIAWDKQ
jgi:hypothetical protein